MRLVVDASIARAAGETQHPTSKLCRETLDIVLTKKYVLVLSRAIADEWKTHRSVYATTWLSTMIAKRRIVRVEGEPLQTFRNTLATIELGDADMRAMMKDVHLIEAALSFDRRIFSLDEAARLLFIGASAGVGELRQLIWANLTRDDDRAIVWLVDGAPFEKQRCIGFDKS